MVTFGYDPLTRKGVFLVGHGAQNERGRRMWEGGRGEGDVTSLKRVNEMFCDV